MIIKNPLIVSVGGGDTTTVKKLLDATKSCYYLFSAYKGTSIDGLITYDDTSNVNSMDHMFNKCLDLTTVPQLNTSNVTNMSNMFNNCLGLTTVPQLNTSNVTDMSNMFNNCSKLTTVPQLNTSKVTNMKSMFYSCYSLTTVPALDTSKVANMSNMFQGCSNLKSILMTGMKVSFNISYSTKFEQTDLVTILNNLATVTNTKNLIMGATNLAKLTEEDKAIATNKGWTLA